ncbi:uncharacterized protein [Procambarus clarkii]|uniref:uncharacterized protein n=1 Tax=Procambarus clarkii TaxID=6728 RepID=UPI001E6700A3|nr:uncharacterized protein LOC123770416 [Procambarus clarkii]
MRLRWLLSAALIIAVMALMQAFPLPFDSQIPKERHTRSTLNEESKLQSETENFVKDLKNLAINLEQWIGESETVTWLKEKSMALQRKSIYDLSNDISDHFGNIDYVATWFSENFAE